MPLPVSPSRIPNSISRMRSSMTSGGELRSADVISSAVCRARWYGGRKDDVELVAAGKITTCLAGLFMATLRKWGLQIPKSEVEGVLSGSLRNGFGNVSRGFSVAYDD